MEKAIIWIVWHPFNLLLKKRIKITSGILVIHFVSNNPFRCVFLCNSN